LHADSTPPPPGILTTRPTWGNAWHSRSGSGKIARLFAAGLPSVNFANPQLLIEPDELANLLGAPRLRIFDTAVRLVPAASGGMRAESGIDRYREAHVPGAAFMDLITTFSDRTSGLGFTLPAPAALARTIGEAGIGAEHDVVVYSNGHLMWATRAFWLLRYAGHERVRVLNGGLRAWRTAGLPVATGDETWAPAEFNASIKPELFVDLAGMQAELGNTRTCTINALAPAVYAGTGDQHYGRRGHIPGSLSLHYDRLLEGDRFRDAASIEQTLSEAGLLTAPRVVVYCGGGISATIDAFACLLMGHSDVAVYDGSLAEWVRNPDLPLTMGDRP
jgi:thiosulfate/3-mercaptopyruvate sulfurtransferase